MVASANGGSSCLSVFGLAYDASEREVHVLFSGCPGYMRCIVVPGKGSQRPYAFVQFAEQKDALIAMESRQGTTWEDGGQAVSIELAKRDIPEKFGPRQMRGPHAAADFPPSTALAPIGGAILPPGKRLRQQEAFQPPASSFRAGVLSGGPPSYGGLAVPEAEGPRTLHLGGLPPGLTQADLDNFLSANFGESCLGGNLDAGGGKGGAMGSPRAFVGFATHGAAAEAQVMLEGFSWDGAQLRAEWARTEFRPQAASGKGAATSVPPPAIREPVRPPLEAVHRYDDRGGAGARCTLHFTNLPFMSESDFSNFLSVTFPDQVVCAHFKDLQDGRPPVAWVLFTDDGSAAAAASTFHTFELQGSQVLVQYARTELDPAKFRR